MLTRAEHQVDLRGAAPSAGFSSIENAESSSEGAVRALDRSSTTFELLSLSFGAAQGYGKAGGQRVIADHSPESEPRDIALSGIQLPRDLGRGARATAAFVIGAESFRIRASLACETPEHRVAYIRAWSGDQLRVEESPVEFNDGQAEVDLPVIGIAGGAVQTLDEQWTWECRTEGGTFSTVQCRYAGARIDSFPVRFYFTGSRSINRCPRESYYHVACVVAGAKNAEQAQRDVWSSFTGFRNGRFVTNARGQRLGFWRDQKPGSEQTNFIDRTAQDLVTLTDSSCRAWAELFREALEIHGIQAIVRAVRPKLTLVHPRLGLPTFTVPDGKGGSAVTRTVGILVKPFKWTPHDQLAPSPFTPQQAMVHAAGFKWKLNNPIDAGTARWPQTDTQDLLRPSHTLPQDAGETRGIFGNHAVVLVKNSAGETWFDPSFGFGPHSSLKIYEDELLGRGEENHGGLFAIVGWKREEKIDPSTGRRIESSAGVLLGAAPPPPMAVLEAVDPG